MLVTKPTPVLCSDNYETNTYSSVGLSYPRWNPSEVEVGIPGPKAQSQGCNQLSLRPFPAPTTFRHLLALSRTRTRHCRLISVGSSLHSLG